MGYLPRYQSSDLSAHASGLLPFLLVRDGVYGRKGENVGVDNRGDEAYQKVHGGDVVVVTQLQDVLELRVLFDADPVGDAKRPISETRKALLHDCRSLRK